MMLPVIATFVGVLALCSAETRIIGGTDVKAAGEFPYIISLQNRSKSDGSYRHFCAGSITSPTTVVTAAHCVWDLVNSTSTLQILAGAVNIAKAEPSQQRANISKIYVPANYTSNNTAGPNDIAVLQLATPLVFNANVSAVALNNASNSVEGKKCVAAGWGNHFPISAIYQTRSPQLKMITTKVLSNKTCHDLYPFNPEALATAICTKAGPQSWLGTITNPFNIIGTCQGDSGGPLVCFQDEAKKTGPYLAGVTSWGFIACGTLPDVFTDVRVTHWFLDPLIPTQ